MKALVATTLIVVVLVSTMFVGMLAAPLAVFPWLASGPSQAGSTLLSIGPIGSTPVPGVNGSGFAAVVATARQWLSPPVPYLFGGCSRSGVDCSCLTQLVYQAVGLPLPRTAQAQWNATVRVDQVALQPGDLVFFAHTYPSADAITHVGIYIGGGLQINAPDTGGVVSIQPVFSGFWGAHFAGGGRLGG